MPMSKRRSFAVRRSSCPRLSCVRGHRLDNRARNMAKTKRISVIWLIIISISQCAAGADSQQQKVDPFADVPSTQRESLKARLYEFVEYHRTKQWGKVYDLLGEQGKAGIQGKLSKER